MEEIWKDIAGYEGHYMVSNTGKVYSHKRKRFSLLQRRGITKFVYVRMAK